MSDRIQREREFHNVKYGDGGKTATAKYYSVVQAGHQDYHDCLTEDIAGKRALEYGCGPGSAAFLLAERGAVVTGIDISEVAIRHAEQQAQAAGLANASFRVMNAEALDFGDDSFDLICGAAILHHLDLRTAYRELARTLKPSGKAVFIEAMGHNPLINLYRRLTPRLRTADEHPLRLDDLRLAGQYFSSVGVRYYHLLNLAAVPLRRLPGFSLLVKALSSLDQAVFLLLPWARRWAWMCVVELSGPIKPPPPTSARAESL